MFQTLLKSSRCLKTGNGPVGASCKSNFVLIGAEHLDSKETGLF